MFQVCFSGLFCKYCGFLHFFAAGSRRTDRFFEEIDAQDESGALFRLEFYGEGAAEVSGREREVYVGEVSLDSERLETGKERLEGMV
jgi:hypothetical protein